MSLKKANISSEVADIVNAFNGIDKNNTSEIADVLKRLADSDKVDLAKGLNLAGISKEVAQSALQMTNLKDATKDITDAMDDFSKSQKGLSGIKGIWEGLKQSVSGAGQAFLKFFSTTAGKITTGVGVVAALYGAYKAFDNYKYEQTMSRMSEWTEENQTLEEQIALYEELKNKIDEGGLSSQEEYNIRYQILEIQNQITDTYGNQVQGIDLVNGSLQEQLSLLQGITAEQANQFLNDASDWQTSKAKKQMESLNQIKFTSINSGTDEYKIVKQAMQEINSKYGEELFSFMENAAYSYTGSEFSEMDIKFAGNARTTQAALNDLLTAMRDAQNQYGDDNSIFANVYDTAKSAYDDATDTITTYGKLYDKVNKAELISNVADFGGHTAIEWYNNFAEAIDKYNSSLKNGTSTEIEAAKDHYQNMKNSIDVLLNNTEMGSYDTLFSDLNDTLDTEMIRIDEFKAAVAGRDIDFNGWQKNVNIAVQALKSYGLTSEDIYQMLSTPVIEENEHAIRALIDAAISSNYIADMSASEIEKLINYFIELGYVVDENSQSLSNDIMSLEQYQEKVSSTSDTLSILNDVLSSQNNLTSEMQSSIVSAFGNLDNFDQYEIFDATSDGVQLNIDALENLIDTQDELIRSDFKKAIDDQNQKLIEQTKLWRNSSNEDKKAEYEKVQAIQDTINAYKLAQAEYLNYYNQQKELFSDYNAWQTAQSTENAGDRYDQMVSGLKTAYEDYKQGKIGTDDFKSFAALISPSGATDAENFAENYKKASRYLTEDNSGVVNFMKDLDSKGLAEFNTQTGEFISNINDIRQASKQMGMGEEFMEVMFGRMEDFGFTNAYISSIEDGQLKIEKTAQELVKARQELAALKATDPTNTTAIEAKQAEIDNYVRSIQSYEQTLSSFTANDSINRAESLKEAKQSYDDLTARYNELKDDTSLSSIIERSEIRESLLNLAKELNIPINEETFEVDANVWNDLFANIPSLENPITPAYVKDTENYNSALAKVKDNWDANKDSIQASLDVLSSYSSDELQGINLDDGEYSEGLIDAEKALDNIKKTFGLTTDEAIELVAVLESIGLISGNTSNTLGLITDLQQASTIIQELQSSGIISEGFELNVDISSVQEADAEIAEIEAEKARLEEAIQLGTVDTQAAQGAIEVLDASLALLQDKNLQLHIEESGMTIEELLSLEDAEFAATLGINPDEESVNAAKQKLQSSLDAETDDTITFEMLLNMDPSVSEGLTILQEINAELEKIKEANPNIDIGGNYITENETIRVLAERIASLPVETQLILGVDPNNVGDVEAIISNINSLEEPKTVTITKVDDSAVLNYEITSDNGTIVFSYYKETDDIINYTRENTGNTIVYDKIEDITDGIEVDPKYGSLFFNPEMNPESDLNTVISEQLGLAQTYVDSNPLYVKMTLTQDDFLGQFNQKMAEQGNQTFFGTTYNATIIPGNVQQDDPVTVEGVVDVTGYNMNGLGSNEGDSTLTVPVTAEGDPEQTKQAITPEENVIIPVDADTTQAENNVDDTVDYTESQNPVFRVDANTSPAKSDVSFAIHDISKRTAEITVKANYDALRDSINRVMNQQFSIRVAAQVSGLPKEKQYTGTMTSIASHASGTIPYNVLNTTPAYANGKISLPHNETALVNELGMNNAAIIKYRKSI